MDIPPVPRPEFSESDLLHDMQVDDPGTPMLSAGRTAEGESMHAPQVASNTFEAADPTVSGVAHAVAQIERPHRQTIGTRPVESTLPL